MKALTVEVVEWLSRNLPPDYHWPGNIRELEQCVRNIMIHGRYEPSDSVSLTSAAGVLKAGQLTMVQGLVDQIQSLSLTADELLCHYCKMAYDQTRSFEKAAKLLQLDRRTVLRRLICGRIRAVAKGAVVLICSVRDFV